MNVKKPKYENDSVDVVFKTGYSARMTLAQKKDNTDSSDTRPDNSDNISADKRSDTESVKSENGGYENKQEPTRYGDWEIAGRCIDF